MLRDAVHASQATKLSVGSSRLIARTNQDLFWCPVDEEESSETCYGVANLQDVEGDKGSKYLRGSIMAHSLDGMGCRVDCSSERQTDLYGCFFECDQGTALANRL